MIRRLKLLLFVVMITLVFGCNPGQSKKQQPEKEETPNRIELDTIKAMDLHKNPVLYAYRAKVYSSTGETDLAISDYTKAIEVYPHDADLYAARAREHISKGDYDHAIDDLTRAIELDPDDRWHYGDRALAYAQKGDYERAIIDMTNRIERTRYYPDYDGRAKLYWEMGDYDRAIDDYTKAIATDLLVTDSYVYRGILYSAKGDVVKATEDFNKAARLQEKRD